MKTVGTGAAVLDLKFQIGSSRTLLFDFDVDISSWAFEFFIREYKGSRVKILSYTLANGGLNYPIYSDAVQANFTSASTTINEGEYYWELRRTDYNVPLINGRAWFSFDAPEGDTDVPLTVTIGSQEITITVESGGAIAATQAEVNTGTVSTEFVSPSTLANLLPDATALTNAATMDLSTRLHTLSTSSATRTFTISYTGADINLVVVLSATSSTFTFPATALCVSEGVASGNNTCALSGASGDTYVIAIKKVGSAYYVVSKNFGQ